MAGFPILIILCYMSFNFAESSLIPDWDVLIFTQQWPKSVCKEWKKEDQSHSCLLPKEQDSWTIHGIWPTKFGTLGPAFCNRSWHFDPEKIRPFESTLTQLWPSVELGPGRDIYSIWAHEWTKHGTCAAILDTFNSEDKYFMQGINWLNKYSMNNILKSSGIVPSDTQEYTVQKIHDTIKNQLGVNAAIECRKDKGKNYLIELRICFKKNLEITDCDGIKYYETTNYDNLLTNCNTSEGVLYIETLNNKSVPNELLVQLYKFVSWLQWFTL